MRMRRINLVKHALTSAHAPDLHPAMKMLGLNPMEQEIIDLTNEIARKHALTFAHAQDRHPAMKICAKTRTNLYACSGPAPGHEDARPESPLEQEIIDMTNEIARKHPLMFAHAQNLHPAMKMLGLNPMEQEIIDLTNEIARKHPLMFAHAQDLHPAMKMLGLNPMEQEIIDLTNEIARNGFIYFPEFCAIITRYRIELQALLKTL
jgi:uncharacterized small protein (DUF1192 family)